MMEKVASLAVRHARPVVALTVLLFLISAYISQFQETAMEERDWLRTRGRRGRRLWWRTSMAPAPRS